MADKQMRRHGTPERALVRRMMLEHERRRSQAPAMQTSADRCVTPLRRVSDARSLSEFAGVMHAHHQRDVIGANDVYDIDLGSSDVTDDINAASALLQELEETELPGFQLKPPTPPATAEQTEAAAPPSPRLPCVSAEFRIAAGIPLHLGVPRTACKEASKPAAGSGRLISSSVCSDTKLNRSTSNSCNFRRGSHNDSFRKANMTSKVSNLSGVTEEITDTALDRTSMMTSVANKNYTHVRSDTARKLISRRLTSCLGIPQCKPTVTSRRLSLGPVAFGSRVPHTAASSSGWFPGSLPNFLIKREANVSDTKHSCGSRRMLRKKKWSKIL